METIKSLAEKLNVSPNTIRLHLKQLFVKNDDLIKHVKFTTKMKKYNFDNTLTKEIIASFKHTANRKSERAAGKLEIQKFTDNMQNLIQKNKTLVHNVGYLEKSNNNLMDSNKKLEKLLDHQQQLQLASKNENDKLKHQIKRLKLPNGKNETHSTTNEKHGFWWKLFH